MADKLYWPPEDLIAFPDLNIITYSTNWPEGDTPELRALGQAAWLDGYMELESYLSQLFTYPWGHTEEVL